MSKLGRKIPLSLNKTPSLGYFNVLELLLSLVVDTASVFPAKDPALCAGDLGLFLWLGLVFGTTELFAGGCVDVWSGRPTSGLILLL